MSDANQLPTHPINNQSILEASYFRMEDLYQVLGLGKTASQSEIKTAYKKQVSDSGLLHPKSNTIRDKLMLIRSAPLFTSYSGSEMSSRSSIAREERTSDHSIQTDSKGLWSSQQSIFKESIRPLLQLGRSFPFFSILLRRQLCKNKIHCFFTRRSLSILWFFSPRPIQFHLGICCWFS